MICPACGSKNLPGSDRCGRCSTDLMQEDVPQPDTPTRWRVMVDPVSSLEASTIPPQLVRLGSKVADAVARMQDKNVGYVLVTDAKDCLVGILTETDVIRGLDLNATDLGQLPVDQLMQAKPTTLRPHDPISYALHFMALNNFMYLPVVDDEGRPIDLLSFRRIIRLIEQME